MRIAVRYKGIPLMPMKSRRVGKYLRLGKARIRYDRKLKIHYLQLRQSPSDMRSQDITLGLDPGSSFDGISVVSADTHHVNIELIQRAKKGKNTVKTFKTRQASNRRIRRSRLRHRRIRFSNRTKKNSLTPTIRTNLEFRQWAIKKLSRIYPITRVVIEDVRFNHAKNQNGCAFSLVEQGKSALYKWIKNSGLLLDLYNGWDTKKLRVNTFGGDPKVKEKASRSFEAHCVDSFVLACTKDWVVDQETGEVLMAEPVAINTLEIHKAVTFIEKIIKVRRSLTLTRKLYTTKHNQIGPQYYRQTRGGIKVIYKNFSNKRNICRVKSNGEHSNHPLKWEYIDNGFAERFKYNTAGFGGTSRNGKKKFFNSEEWSNRLIYLMS